MPTLNCPMHLVLAALNGADVQIDPVVLTPPTGVGSTVMEPPPGGLGPQGSWAGPSLSSAHFFAAWEDGEATTVDATAALASLEAAWSTLVDTQGWTPPVSSDDYLIWVLLDPDLSGTGLTTTYTNDEYPNGYPAIYMNPTYSWEGEFWASLAAHEFLHTLQYAIRDWRGASAETWYWEASAEWGVTDVHPHLTVFANSAVYYTTQPQLPYDSTVNSHQYGMFLINAHIENGITGPGGMQAIWERGSSQPEDEWDTIISTELDMDLADIWGGFAQTVGNGQLPTSNLYPEVLITGEIAVGTAGTIDYLATDYYEVTEDGRFTTNAPDAVVLSSAQGFGSTIAASPGDIIGVTGLVKNNAVAYTIEQAPDAPDTGDTGDTADITEASQENCGCHTSAPTNTGWMLLPLIGALLRRYQRLSESEKRTITAVSSPDTLNVPLGKNNRTCLLT